MSTLIHISVEKWCIVWYGQVHYEVCEIDLFLYGKQLYLTHVMLWLEYFAGIG